MKPKLLASVQRRLSPWLLLSERTYDMDGREQVFHFVKPPDYANSLVLTQDGGVVLVRQYRPALDCMTLELPGGLVEEGEDPAERAMTELWEETGFTLTRPAEPLPVLRPDTGRLENHLYGFVIRDAVFSNPAWAAEPGVEPVVLSMGQFRETLLFGGISHAGHVGLIGLALAGGLLQLNAPATD